MEIKALATGFVLENRVRMILTVVQANTVVVPMPHALQNVLGKCVPVLSTVQMMYSAVVMLLVIYANVRNHALVYRAQVTVNADQAKDVVRTRNAP